MYQEIVYAGGGSGAAGGVGYSVVLPRVLPLQYRDIVEQYAAEYGLEEAFVYGVISAKAILSRMSYLLRMPLG